MWSVTKYNIYNATSAKRFERENPLLLVLSEGTKYALNAPGKDWNRDLSMPRVRICEKSMNMNQKNIRENS